MKMAQPVNEGRELLPNSEVLRSQQVERTQETGTGGQVQSMEEEIDPGGMQGCLSTSFCRVCGLFALALGACCLLAFLMNISIMPVLGKWACSETEVARHCKHELILEVKEPPGTPPGTQCKVLATAPWPDQPCCYNDKGTFDLNDVCFEDANIARRTDEAACRVGSRYPEVKMVDGNCTITLKDLDEQDARCYEFFMPPNSPEPFYRKCVENDEICHDWVKHSCKEKHWQIQFVGTAVILVTIVLIFIAIIKRMLKRRRRVGEGGPPA